MIAAALCVVAGGIGWAATTGGDSPDPVAAPGAAPAATPTTAAAPVVQDVPRGTPQVTSQPLTSLSDLPVSTPDASAAPTTGDITVSVSYHAWDPARRAVVVGGYVDSVVESGGTCTLTLTQGQASLTGSTEARPDAASTDCGEIAVADGLTSGSWQVVLGYSSADHRGSSPAVTVEVP